MTKKEAIKIFEEKKVRTIWDDETEEWYFSVVDVVSILTDSTDGRKYWNKLKQRLKAEGSELVTICHQLTPLCLEASFCAVPIFSRSMEIRLLRQNAHDIHNGEEHFAGLGIHRAADPLLFKFERHNCR